MILMDKMGHLVSTESGDELHEFAEKIGLKREWYQMPGYGEHHAHYDLTTPRARIRAREGGAIEVGPFELVRKTWWYEQPHRALSLYQPWADLIVDGIKPIENRLWSSKYRGGLLIHASKKWDSEGAQWIVDNTDAPLKCKVQYTFGAFIGQVNMVGCTQKSDSIWFFGPYGFIFEKAKRYKRPILWSGQRRIFSVPADELRKLLSSKQGNNH